MWQSGVIRTGQHVDTVELNTLRMADVESDHISGDAVIVMVDMMQWTEHANHTKQFWKY